MVWKPNTTVAAIVERGNKLLTVEELVLGEQVINQPAGHLYSDESLVEPPLVKPGKKRRGSLNSKPSLAYLYRRQSRCQAAHYDLDQYY